MWTKDYRLNDYSNDGRDALLRVRESETQHGRGAARPYPIRFVRPKTLSIVAGQNHE